MYQKRQEFIGFFYQPQKFYRIAAKKLTHAELLAEVLQKHYIDADEDKNRNYIAFTQALIHELNQISGDQQRVATTILQSLSSLEDFKQDNLFSILSAYFYVFPNQIFYLPKSPIHSQLEQIYQYIIPQNEYLWSDINSIIIKRLTGNFSYYHSEKDLQKTLENLVFSGYKTYIPTSFFESVHQNLWRLKEPIKQSTHHIDKTEQAAFVDTQTAINRLKLVHVGVPEITRTQIVYTLIWIMDEYLRASQSTHYCDLYALWAIETLCAMGNNIPKDMHITVIKKILAVTNTKLNRLSGFYDHDNLPLTALFRLPADMLKPAEKLLKRFTHQALSRPNPDWLRVLLFGDSYLNEEDKRLLKQYLLNTLKNSSAQDYITVLGHSYKVKGIFTTQELEALLDQLIEFKLTKHSFQVLINFREQLTPDQNKRVSEELAKRKAPPSRNDWEDIAHAYFEQYNPNPDYSRFAQRLIELITRGSISSSSPWHEQSIRPAIDALHHVLSFLSVDELSYFISCQFGYIPYCDRENFKDTMDYTDTVSLILHTHYTARLRGATSPIQPVACNASPTPGKNIFDLIDEAELNGELTATEQTLYDQLTCPLTFNLVREPFVVFEKVSSPNNLETVSRCYIFEKKILLEALSREELNPISRNPLSKEDYQPCEAVEKQVNDLIHAFALRNNLVLNGKIATPQTLSNLSLFTTNSSASSLIASTTLEACMILD